MKKVYKSIFIFIFLIFIISCSNEVTNNKILIAVSIPPQRNFVEEICGNDVEVVVMIPPGKSTANYEPTPKEMQQFNKSIVFFAIGIPAELSNILPLAKEVKNMKIIKLNEEVAKVYPDRKFTTESRDPHIWLSHKRVKVMIDVIADVMSSININNKEKYLANAQIYKNKLDILDISIYELLENIINRKFIVFHPAFGYLADDYDLKMYSLEHDGKESTPQQIIELINFAKSENIKVIFYQMEISSKQANSFKEQIDGEMIQLDPLAPNYIDNLKKMIELIVGGMV